MLTIQEVGTEILGNTPKKFYVFGGTEYGIKCKYIDILKSHYGKFKECQSVNEIIKLMSTRHFIPLEPTLYIIRYDDEFLSSLSDDTEKIIDKLNIIGTIVCIYELDKHVIKCSKYLSNYTVKIDPVSTNFKVKYLHSDFPHMPDRFINIAATYGIDYNDAKNMCRSMSQVDVETLFEYSDDKILALFGKQKPYDSDSIKRAVMNKNFNFLVRALDQYEDCDSFYYMILASMLDLEKGLSSKYPSNEIKEYLNYWFEQDVYNMFMLTYNEIAKTRSYATDVRSSLLYLFAFLKFKRIPSVEFMENE